MYQEAKIPREAKVRQAKVPWPTYVISYNLDVLFWLAVYVIAGKETVSLNMKSILGFPQHYKGLPFL